MKVQIESRCLQDMVLNQIIPTAVQYQSRLAMNVTQMKEIFGATFKKQCEAQIQLIEELSERVNFLKKTIEDMRLERKKANALSSAPEQAKAYCDHVFSKFDDIRYHVDKLEVISDNELWPLPKYREMLFTR